MVIFKLTGTLVTYELGDFFFDILIDNDETIFLTISVNSVL